MSKRSLRDETRARRRTNKIHINFLARYMHQLQGYKVTRLLDYKVHDQILQLLFTWRYVGTTEDSSLLGLVATPQGSIAQATTF